MRKQAVVRAVIGNITGKEASLALAGFPTEFHSNWQRWHRPLLPRRSWMPCC